MKKAQCKVKAGIIYFISRALAEDYRNHFRVEFPDMKIRDYLLGYALQVHDGGDYIGPNMRPSMETRMRAFDHA